MSQSKHMKKRRLFISGTGFRISEPSGPILICSLILLLACVMIFTGSSAWCAKKKCRILIVHSYHENMPWVQDYTRGIRTTLLKQKDFIFAMKNFYMDSKRHPELSENKGQEAFRIFSEWKPDAVIACDDNAQKFFVVPYLKGKTAVPVVFLGVNEDPEVYGYPAKNVTGVLERNHVAMTIKLLQRLKPGCRRVAVINDASPTGLILTDRIRKALSRIPASQLVVTGYFNTNSFEEWKWLVKDFQKTADGIYFVTYYTFHDKDGRHVPVLEALKWLILNSRIPEASNTMDTVRNGALCSIAIDGFVSGEEAAGLLLKILRGVKPSRIPLKRTERGLRLINRSRARMLDIKIPPFLIPGTIFFDSPFLKTKPMPGENKSLKHG